MIDVVAHQKIESRIVLPVLSAVVFLLSIIEVISVSKFSWQETVFTALQLLCILMLPFIPDFFSASILVLYIIESLCPLTMQTSQLWGLWLATGVIGYYLPTLYSSLLVSFSVIARLLDTIFYFSVEKSVILGTTSLIVISYGFFAIGVVFRNWKNEKLKDYEERRLWKAESENSLLKRDRELAIELHDSVAGGLSYLALITSPEYQMSGLENGIKQENKNEEIHSVALSSINKVHGIINLLSTQGSADQLEKGKAKGINGIQFKKLLESGNQSLQAFGYQGICRVDPEIEKLRDNSTLKVVATLADEIYRNILKHCLPDTGSYEINVFLKEGKLTLTESNPVKSTRIITGPFISGHGLRLHFARIRSLGGHARYENSRDMWTIFVSVPIS